MPDTTFLGKYFFENATLVTCPLFCGMVKIANKTFKVLREMPLFFERPMKDSETSLRFEDSP